MCYYCSEKCEKPLIETFHEATHGICLFKSNIEKYFILKVDNWGQMKKEAWFWCYRAFLGD